MHVIYSYLCLKRKSDQTPSSHVGFVKRVKEVVFARVVPTELKRGETILNMSTHLTTILKGGLLIGC